MTMTALQKGCDQDDLAVNTTNTFRGDAIPRQPVHPIASLEPQPNSKGPNAACTKLPLE
jgi:hypothetical protein